MRGIVIFFVGAVLILAGCGGARAGFAPAPAGERTAEIGLLFRKQFTADITQKRHYRHVQMIMADGRIYDFNTRERANSFLHNIIFKSGGEVRTLPELRRLRPYYVSAAIARDCRYKERVHQKMVTDWVKFKVTPAQAQALLNAWRELAAAPPEFRLRGMNCATRAYQCMERAGILPGAIPGIDRPENMLKPLCRYYPDCTRETGYFGVDAAGKPYMEPLP